MDFRFSDEQTTVRDLARGILDREVRPERLKRHEADGASVDRALWSKLHLQIIYFGREHCPALRHDHAACPICSWAASAKVRAEGAASSPPRKPVKARSTKAAGA